MTKTLAATVIFLTLFAWHADGQVKKRKAVGNPLERPLQEQKGPVLPVYTFIVEIASNKSMRIEVRTGHDSWDRDPAMLKKALADYIAIQERKPFQAAVAARVVVRAADSLDTRSVIEILKTARQGSSELSVDIGDYYSMKIPAEPDDRPNFDVKPNPLTLLAAFDEKGAITLNSEPQGNLQDLSKIRLKLKEIFKAREDNGVFRENSNDVEKTMFVRVPLTSRFEDVKAFALALSETGSDQLWLQIDDLDKVDTRKELVDIFRLPEPSTPRPKRKPNE